MAVRAYAPSTPFAVTDGSQLWGCGTAEAVPGYMVCLSQNRDCEGHLLICTGRSAIVISVWEIRFFVDPRRQFSRCDFALLRSAGCCRWLHFAWWAAPRRGRSYACLTC